MINWRPPRTSSRGAPRHVQQRAARRRCGRSPIMSGLDQIPAEERDPFQLALEDEERLLEELQQREGLPHRLMFRGDDQRPLRNLLERRETRPWCCRSRASARCCCAPTIWRPSAWPRAASAKVGSATSSQTHQQHIEQHVEDQRTQENRNHRDIRSIGLTPSPAGAAAAIRSAGRDISGARSRPTSASRTRTSAATYLAYSDSSSRSVAPLVHHGSSRHLSPTTANGISVDIRHRMRQFDDGARHVVVRGHHDQRLEAALARPAPGLRGIAAGVDGGAVEIDAAAQQRLVVRQRAGNVAGRRWSDARRRSAAACRSRRPAIPSRRRPATSRRSAPRCRRHCGRASISAPRNCDRKPTKPTPAPTNDERQRGDDGRAQPAAAARRPAHSAIYRRAASSCDVSDPFPGCNSRTF